MKALVCVKRVVDYAVKVRVARDMKGVELSNVKMSMNPFCEIAVEEGIRLKEKGVVSELVVVSIGATKAQETIRQALAMGADKGIFIETDKRTDQDLQPLAVAKVLEKVVQNNDFQLVICGKQAIDGDNNQVGQLLASRLDWPQATFASEVEIDAGTMKVEREVDAGVQKLEMPVPAVITADLRLNQPRYATLPNLMKAKKKPMDSMKIEDFGVDLAPRLTVLKVEEPPARAGGTTVASVDELIEKLKSEAKVI